MPNFHLSSDDADVPSPAFQFYVNDFLASAKVMLMDADEVGAYLLLLCLDWQEDGFAYDEKSLAKWCRLKPARFRKAWVRLAPCFVEHDGRYHNERLQIEREKQDEWRKKSAKGAATANAKRWAKGRGGDEMATANESPEGRTSFLSPSLSSVSSFPAAALGPDVAHLLDVLGDDDVRFSWSAHLMALNEGMGAPRGQAVSAEKLNAAAQQYVGSGAHKKQNLRHFDGFVESVMFPATKIVAANGLRPTKQEAGVANLQAAIERRERERATNGE